MRVPTHSDPAASLSFTPEQFLAFVRQLRQLTAGNGEPPAVRRVILSDGAQDIALDIDPPTLTRIATYLQDCQESYEGWIGQARQTQA